MNRLIDDKISEELGIGKENGLYIDSKGNIITKQHPLYQTLQEFKQNEYVKEVLN